MEREAEGAAVRAKAMGEEAVAAEAQAMEREAEGAKARARVAGVERATVAVLAVLAHTSSAA